MSKTDIKGNTAVNSEGNIGITTKRQKKFTPVLALSAFSAIQGALQFGYNQGVINAPEKKIKAFLNETSIARYDASMESDVQLNLFSLLVAILPVGGLFGGVLAGWWADFFGRKMGMLVNNIFAVVSSVLMFFCRIAQSYEMIIVGRFLIGINCGLASGLSPLYLSEIATSTARGALGTVYPLGLSAGLLFSQILGFPEILGNEQHWHILLGLCLVPAALQLITMPFCPESPRYLLLKKQQEDDAMKALVRLRGTRDVDEELQEIKNEYDAERSSKTIGIVHLFRKKSLRMPLLLGIGMHLSQQLSGIVAIFYYSSKLFTSVGLSDASAAHATSAIGAILVVMTLVTVPLMDRAGRRSLHLIGVAGMFISSTFITITLYFNDTVKWFNTASIVFYLLDVIFFAIGPGNIPWMIVAELFTQDSRVAAVSVSVMINWTCNFVVGYTFPLLQEKLDDFSFVPFTAMLGILWLFIFKFLPETKNKTFEEIASSWTNRNISSDSKNIRALYKSNDGTEGTEDVLLEFQPIQNHNEEI